MIDRVQFALCVSAVQSYFQQSHFPTGVFYQHLVGFADTQFTEHVVRDIRSCCLYEIVELQIFGVLDGFTVNHHLTVYNLKGITGQTDTTLHIILATVYRAPEDFTISAWVVHYLLPSGGIVQVVNGTLLRTGQAIHLNLFGVDALSLAVSQCIEVCCLLVLHCYRIACREIEHDNVIQLHLAESRNPFVLPLRPFNI